MSQLLSSLPIGAKVKFGKYDIGGVTYPITWLVVAKNHTSTPTYPSNSVTLLSEKIIDSLALDAREPNNTSNSSIPNDGNAIYKYANIDQWLNKDGSSGTWYTAAHNADQSPTDAYVVESRGYANKAGFLNAFTADEKNAILNTYIRISMPRSTLTEDIVRKVFLPSTRELGWHSAGGAEGATWEYFNISNPSENMSHWICPMTPELYNSVTFSAKPSAVSGGYFWWTRTCYEVSQCWYIEKEGRPAPTSVALHLGIRPALNLSSSATITDTTDSDGCYSVIFNSAPPKPTSINLPSTIYGGKSNTVSWTKVTDPDGDTVTYQLECAINNGSYTQIYSGTTLTYAHLVPFGTSTVSYRVKAIDPSGESSAYTTSATVNVINNNAPVISGTDTNLGVKDTGFTGTYTITDANSDAVTVTEAIDGVQIRALVATLGQSITYGITGNTWLALSNGSHTLTIRATDGIDTTVRTYTFTKLVDSFTITNSTPWKTDTMPTRIMVVVTRNIPSGATFKVEVCNDGYAASPTWEDCTDAVKSGLVHVFKNTTNWSTAWGVCVRVTVERNGASGACYVSAIGGNFE